MTLATAIPNRKITLMKKNGNGFRKMDVDSDNNVTESSCR
jgi:hypothetical protein